jgi:hypothetical protein
MYKCFGIYLACDNIFIFKMCPLKTFEFETPGLKKWNILDWMGFEPEILNL